MGRGVLTTPWLRPVRKLNVGATAATALAMAIALVVVHLTFAAPVPGDVDSMNFALGVRDFDVARHQPHPPGAPVYVGLGKVVAVGAEWLGIGGAGVIGLEPVALSALAAISSGVLFFSLFQVFGALRGDATDALLAAALAAACPLTWMLASRPFSDVPGLALATVSQALLLRPGGRPLLFGAILGGLAGGIRIQALLLTLPPLVLRLLTARRAEPGPAARGAVGLYVAAIAAWCLVLIVDGGGLRGYGDLLAVQMSEDAHSQQLFWQELSPRVGLSAALHILVFPWGASGLAAVVLLLASIGTVRLLVQRRWFEAVLLAALWGPYLCFHVLAQEVWTVRYALPLIPPLAYLALQGARTLWVPARIAVATALVAASAFVSVTASREEAKTGPTWFQLVGDMRERAPGGSELLLSHWDIGVGLRRSEELLRVPPPWTRIQMNPGYEWLQVAAVWRELSPPRLWFVANPRRKDLALFDPTSLELVGAYRAPELASRLLAGSRPGSLDWYEMRAPNWMALEGWALTPEASGISTAAGQGPHRRPVTALLRPLTTLAGLMVGGRHLGDEGRDIARVSVRLQQRLWDTFDVGPGTRNFLRFYQLPPSSSASSADYLHLTIEATSANSGSGPPVALEQFDYQPEARVLFGYGEGWHEQELDVATGQQWRWTNATAILQIRAPGDTDVAVSLALESPRRYFGDAATFTLRAGSALVLQRRVASDERVTACVPARLLSQAAGALTLSTDRTFVPAAGQPQGDQRRLGLRVFGARVVPASCEAARAN